METNQKLTRKQTIALAQAARKLPVGIISERVYIQNNARLSDRILEQKPAERGATYALGAALEESGYLLIYDILDKLGIRIISTIVGKRTTIVLRNKSYEGESQSTLLLQILKDCLGNPKPHNTQ